MFTEPTDIPEAEQQRRVEAIVANGPGGAFAVAGAAVAGAAVAIVMALWLAFYLMVFAARGGM